MSGNESLDIMKLFEVPLFNAENRHKSAKTADWGDVLEALDSLWDEGGEEDDNRSYLVRDQKIETLVREKARRELRTVVQQDFFKLFQASAIESRRGDSKKLFLYLSDTFAKKVVKPTFDSLAEKQSSGEAVDWNASLKPFFGEVTPQIDPNVDGTSIRLLQRFLKREKLCAVSLEMNGKKTALVIDGSLTKGQREKSWCFKAEKNYRFFADAASIKDSALYVAIDQAFAERVNGMDKETLLQDVVYRTLCDRIMGVLNRYVSERDFVMYDKIFTEYPGIVSFLEEHDLQCLPVPEAMRNNEVRRLFNVWPFSEQDIGVIAPFDATIPRCKLLATSGFDSWLLQDIYMNLFMLLYEEWLTAEQTKVYLREVSGSARVYQTKKNIPEKYLLAMQESEFNQYFSYVEFDDECDLVSIKEIEKEFLALKMACFDDAKYEATLRFRKLGRHHAAGLYFPCNKCLCVDIRNPSSMGHEYLHMYDYFHGVISSTYDFYEIRNRYGEVLRAFADKLRKEDALKMRLLGSTKYNLKYYLEPTEIFARCGELYFTRIQGVDNSLLKPEYNFAYPKDEQLMKLIGEFYGTLFGRENAVDEIEDERRKAG